MSAWRNRLKRSPHRSRNHADCISCRALTASLEASPLERAAERNCVPGDRIQHQTGQSTPMIEDLLCRGGMFTMRRRISPLVTASRCAQIASM